MQSKKNAPGEAVRRSDSKPEEIVVFSILRDSKCSECDTELGRHELLRMQQDKPLCLACADLDHLVYLPSGDAALTRRAKKGSTLWAVVVEFSRSRGRYERQGLLVEEAALERAEKECLADADARASQRERNAERRERLDSVFVATFARAIRDRYPGCPNAEETAIAEHACRKHSDRVGRTAAAKRFEAEAIDYAVRAHVRHVHTKYDDFLASGLDRDEAREHVRDEVRGVLDRWRQAARRDLAL